MMFYWILPLAFLWLFPAIFNFMDIPLMGEWYTVPLVISHALLIFGLIVLAIIKNEQ